MLEVFLAIAAGALTIGAPCILPLLPILLATSVGQKSKLRPLFIISGFIVAFTVVALSLSYIISRFHIAPDSLRTIAIIALAIFGLFMLFPVLFEKLTASLGKVTTKADAVGRKAGQGNWGGFVLGLVLGIIWTPCAGPVLGAILTLIATSSDIGRAGILLFAYALGAGLPMLAIAYGSQYITTKVQVIAKYSRRIQKIFGAIVILVAVAMYFQFDLAIQAKLTNLGASVTKSMQRVSEKSETGTAAYPAPEFAGISNWLNSQPLNLKDLKGKVVLVDFWTYSCINCIRTLPHITKWYDEYKDKGLIVIGVHTPEFPFEQVPENVAKAIEQYNIHYPVAQDNDYKTWKAYDNHYWPAKYLIDQEGNIVYTHFGEGDYDQTENAIRKLLGLDMGKSASADIVPGKVRSPEMYFGTGRLENLSGFQRSSPKSKDYVLPEKLAVNTFALEGRWLFASDKISLQGDQGKIRLHFSAGKVFIVAADPTGDATIKVTVDNQPERELIINSSKLYTLFDSADYGEHTLEIDIQGNGFEAFTFTFG